MLLLSSALLLFPSRWSQAPSLWEFLTWLFSFNVLSFSVTQLQLQQQEPFAFVHQVLFEGLWAPVHCRWHCCIPVWDALDTQ